MATTSPLPLSTGLSVLGLLKMLAVSFVCARSTLTDPASSKHSMMMIFEKRNLTNGETVPVVASREEIRKEVVVVCVAPRVLSDVSLVFPVHAQNANLLDVRPEDCDPVPHQPKDVVFACKKITLETGGFLKLRCVLRQPEQSEEIDSVSANFTFTHMEITTTTVPRPVTTPLPHHSYIVRQQETNSAPNESNSPSGSIRHQLPFSLVTLIIFFCLQNIVKLITV